MFKSNYAIACVLVALVSSIGCASESSQDLQAYSARVEGLDREGLKEEILKNAELIDGTKPSAEVQARLDVIEERVDRLDGLFYRTETANGGVLKFYEREPGQLHVAYFGDMELADKAAMGGLTAVEIFRLARPGQPLPEVLAQAQQRAEEVAPITDEQLAFELEHAPTESLPPVEQGAEGMDDGSVIQAHNVSNHGPVSDATWVNRHCPSLGAGLCSHLNGTHTFATNNLVRGIDWSYLLNSGGTGLASLMVGKFSTSPPSGSGQLFGDEWGPWFSGVGTLVIFRTAGRIYQHTEGTLCGFFACEIQTDNYYVNHSAEFTTAPANHWHLATFENNSPGGILVGGDIL